MTDTASQIEPQEPLEVDAVPEAEVVVEPEAPQWDAEAEEQARAFGWMPVDDLPEERQSGAIDDPQAYLDRLENYKPFRQQKQMMDAQREEFEDKFRRLDAMQDQALQRQRQQLEAEFQGVQVMKRKAAEEADVERYDALSQREQNLRQQASEFMPPQQQQPPAPPPEIVTYVNKNEWAQDPYLWQQAVSIVDANPQIQGRPAGEQLAFAEERMRDLFPHKFGSQQSAPRGRQMVDGGGLAGGRGRSGFDKLPSEAKQQFAKYAKQGLFTDDEAGRKEYLESYNEV